eukprot:CAMPEP_0184364186 /NCGR_PEP_ID=MMETSP1089-20130417/143100_1 /TAXON_ID=38269 ORGANISM="Gloeochaete wittrockiana, Strain SAG46.84" /NCGR_SAMPLE_ID=MMETSP1089 /ASSEMBLY_ACC=CAM_ASM_000445 /LENGTH=43 /DNA_ID= /DNA_START= /DNA_END= /DNA_ORIENTATION=
MYEEDFESMSKPLSRRAADASSEIPDEAPDYERSRASDIADEV